MKVNKNSDVRPDAKDFDLKDGWLPKRVNYHNGAQYVELVRVPGKKLTEKFLHWELNRCQEKISVPMEQLLKTGVASRPLAGQIFHLSRVGSTLVSEMFRVLDDCIVLSEPQCISDIFLDPFDVSEEEKLRSIRVLLGIYSHVLGREKKIIVKWTSWMILQVDVINKIFQDVPTCMVVRDPVEILVALAGKPPSWMDRKKMRAIIDKTGGKEHSLYLVSMNNALCGKVNYYSEKTFPGYAAGILAEMCEAALAANPPMMVLDYTDIRDKVPTSLASAFSINPTPKDIEKMRVVCIRDTKTGGRNTYKPDTRRKQIEATSIIRDAAENIVEPVYSMLLKGHKQL